MIRVFVFLIVLISLPGCSVTPFPDFEHTINKGSLPWTDTRPDYDAATVRFAVFSDLTGGERDGVFDVAVAQLNLLRPELVVNVGDLIEGGDDVAELHQQWDAFDGRAQSVHAPVIYTSGNHDVLGKEMRRVWEERIGPRYFHFRYRDVLFLVLDTDDHTLARMQEIIDMRTAAYQIAMSDGWDAFAETAYANHPEDASGMLSSDQAAYMVEAIAANPDVRWTFLMMHKAPWKAASMAGWAAIEAALADRPFTVFHGHRHAYQHEVRNGRDYIRLATTGGVFLPQNGLSMDQLVWVTVDEEGAHIANLKMSGILDKTGVVPGKKPGSICLVPPCE